MPDEPSPDPPRPTNAPAALREFYALYDQGDMDGALTLTEAALSRGDRSAAVHHARGLALWGIGRHEDAAEAIQRAVDLAPALAEAHVDLSILLTDRLSAPEAALDALERGRRAFGDAASRAQLHAARAHAWLALDDATTAAQELERARRLAPEDPEIAVDLAEARVEGFDLAGAERSLDDTLRLDPEMARAYWLRGALRDRRGERDRASDDFTRAAELDPDGYALPRRLAEAEFDRVVEQALTGIPPHFREHLSNVEIAIEPYPTDDIVREYEISPLLLGLFVGIPLPHRTLDAPDLPPRILIFQRNLENGCRSRQELIREIGVTLRHEIGHLLGMDEEAIEAAGHG